MTYRYLAQIRLSATIVAVAYVVGYFVADIGVHLPQPPDFIQYLSVFYSGASHSFLMVPVIFLAGMGIVTSRDYRKKQLQNNAQHSREIGAIEKAISSHAIVSIADRDANIIQVNENFEKILGYSAREIVGQSHEVLYDGTEHKSAFQAVHSKVYNGQVWTGEQKLVAKSGEVVFTQSTIFPIFDAHGNHSRTISIRTDVTGHRIAEAEKNLTSILEDMPDEIFLYSVESLDIIYANKKARARCNWDTEMAKTKRITDGAKTFNDPAYLGQLISLLNGERSEATNEFSNESGHFESTTRLHTGPDEKAMYVTFLRDITEKRKSELEKMQSVSMVSHELRTPLTSIKGSLQLLQSGAVGEVSKNVGQVIDIAVRNSERLLLVVDDILDLEKINSGHMEFVMCSVELKGLVKDSVEANKGFGDAHDVRFKTELPDCPGKIVADPNRLMQVMSNLMSNAVKFSPPGGTVVVSLCDFKGAWRISVSDSGPGIPEKARKTLFDSFVQVESADGIKRTGTGLGLAITKKIVQRLGGKVHFESVLGTGTTFFVDLPKIDSAKGPDIVPAYSTAAE